MRDNEMDAGLERSIHELADAFERLAASEATTVARLEGRLASNGRLRMFAVAAFGVALVLAVMAGVRTLTAPAVGGPATMPALTGVFVTSEPDGNDRCFGLRLYDTTVQDGRVALWAWTATGTGGCSERRDNLSTGLGHAEGIRLDSNAGIAISATGGVPPALDGLVLVLDPGRGADGPFRAYRSLRAATAGDGAVQLERVQTLDIPYRPG